MKHAPSAIALPSRSAWSETFIAAHLERLSDVRLVLSQGCPPECADDVNMLVPRTWNERLTALWAVRVKGRSRSERLLDATVSRLLASRVKVLLAEYGPTGVAMLEACQRARVPLVVHFHGYDAHVHRVVEANGGYRRLFAHASAMVVVSRAMERALLDLGAPREKVKYVCYGIDVQRFGGGDPAKSPPHFLSVGRFVDKKAPHLTILAFAEVVSKCPQARLTMVGDGELRESCRQLVMALGLDDHIHLVGVQSPDRIAELFRVSRAFIQHSVTPASGDHEGTPLAVLEAMASGVPVVATRHAGIPDVVVHGERGLLCDERDIRSMAQHMVQLTEDPAFAASMGRAGRAYVETGHRIEDRIRDLQQILDDVASAR